MWHTYISHSLTNSLTEWSIDPSLTYSTRRLRGIFLQKNNSKIGRFCFQISQNETWERASHFIQNRINITCIRIMLSDISYSQALVLLYHCLSLLHCIVDTHIDYLLTQPFLLEEMDFWNKHTPILNTWEDNIDWAMNNQKCFFCFSSVILARIMYRESSEASSEVSWSPYYYSVCHYTCGQIGKGRQSIPLHVPLSPDSHPCPSCPCSP